LVQLVQPELDVAESAVAQQRGLQAPDEAVATTVGRVDDDLDRVDVLGDAMAGRKRALT
jgi:hypothetical protein